MASKKISIDFDINAKSLKIANGETLNLQQQIKVLTAELRKTSVGTAEFEILSETLKESRDQMELVNAKSKDLFQSFGQIPGPIGQIGFGLDDTVGKLKVFSAFNLKDIKTQFKALGGDFVDIGKNLGKATGLTKLFNASNNLLASGLNKVGISANASSKGLKIFSGALISTGIGALVVGLGLLITNFDKVRDAVFKMFPPLKMLGDAIGSVINFFTDLVGVTSEAERAEEKRQATYAKAKAQTEIINQGIQREINLLKAKGATQEDIDKKERQMIQNQLKDLKGAANERRILTGEQATEYKDLQNQLAVIDATAAKTKADKDKKDAEDRANKSKVARDKATQVAQQEAQKDRDFRQQQADAQVQILKDAADTDEQTLRMALEKQLAIKNEGKRISVDVAKQQANEINKVIQDELKKDVEDRKKANDERITQVKDANKLELESLTVTLEEKKLLYGEESQEVRKVQDDIFSITKKGFDDEKALLDEKGKTKDGLTKDEVNRLKEIEVANRQLTVTVETENQRQINADKDKALAKLDVEKSANDSRVQLELQIAANDFDRQKKILEDKLIADNEYFNAQQILYKGNKEKLDEIDRNRLANQMFISQQEEQIRQRQVGLQLQATDAIINAVGAETAAGRAALIAKQIILAKELILEVKRTIAFSKISLANSKLALAEGAARTAKVGFPQNIPLLILYAAQAASIIGAVISATKSAKDAASASSGGEGDSGGSAAPKPRRLATGGIISGPGTGTSDSIPTLLSNGESVINANSTQMFRPLLSTINAIGGGRQFASNSIGGGMNSSQSLIDLQGSLMGSQQPIKTYVVASDVTSIQQFDRAQKSRSTL
jgi:hypothetical protein